MGRPPGPNIPTETTDSRTPPQDQPATAIGMKRNTATSIKGGQRIGLNAVEGWGKTSYAACAPGRVGMIMAAGETGYETLLSHGLVPEIDTATATTWSEVLVLLRDIEASETPYNVLALDALGGFEELCHQYVCVRDYGGDWSGKGFESYKEGYKVALPDWSMMLLELDRIRAHGTHIVLLGHVEKEMFTNPLGPNYDRWASNVHRKTWSLTHKWLDIVMFGHFFTTVENTDKKKIKGTATSGTVRVIEAEQRDAWVAKNRCNIPATLRMPDEPKQMWPVLAEYIIPKRG